MKFSMYAGFTEMVAANGIEAAAKYAKEHGFSSVEVLSTVDDHSGAIPDADAARKARKVLDNYGLTVACYSTYCNTWTRRDTAQAIRKRVDIAKELGSPYFHHTLLPELTRSNDASDFTEKIQVAVTAAQQIASYAGDLGITCLYEGQGQYVNGVRDFGFFFHEMKKRCKNIGVCADLGNTFFVNEKPEDFLAAYIADVKHVHIKDYLHRETDTSPGMYWVKARGNNWLRDTMIGHGIANYPACLKILKDAGYSGSFALEITHPEPFEAGIQQAMEYTKRFW